MNANETNQRYREIDYHFTECGLPNVYIRCMAVTDDAGEETVIIPRINQLHNHIAEQIVHAEGALLGREIKFLRGLMGLTQRQLGEQIHRTRPTIARWESEKSTIDGAADALIRLLAIDALKLRRVKLVKISQKCTPNTRPKPEIKIPLPDSKGKGLAEPRAA